MTQAARSVMSELVDAGAYSKIANLGQIARDIADLEKQAAKGVDAAAERLAYLHEDFVGARRRAEAKAALNRVFARRERRPGEFNFDTFIADCSPEEAQELGGTAARIHALERNKNVEGLQAMVDDHRGTAIRLLAEEALARLREASPEAASPPVPGPRRWRLPR